MSIGNGRKGQPGKRIVGAILGLAMVVALQVDARAQDQEQDLEERERPLTIDELYLQSETTAETLSKQLRSRHRELQMLALDAIEEQLQSGALGRDNREAYEGVVYVLRDGVHKITYAGQISPHTYHPMVRHRAAEVIAQFDIPQVRTELTMNVVRDPDPAVQARSLYSLAEIGEDPDGWVTENIAKMMLRHHYGRPDYGAVYAALVAIEHINANPGAVVHGAAVEMVLKVAEGGYYNQFIRDKARRVLQMM